MTDQVPTVPDNDEERIARVERMLKELADVEEKASRLAAEVREKAASIARELSALKRTM